MLKYMSAVFYGGRMKKEITSSNEKKQFNTYIFILVFCISVFIFMEAILTPVYIYICNDITVSMSILPTIFDIFMKLIEIFTFAMCFAVVIFSAIKNGKKSAFSICGIYIGTSVLRRLLSLLMSYLISSQPINKYDIFNVSVYIAFEALQIFIVALCCLIIIKKHSPFDVKEKATQNLSDLFSYKNTENKKYACMRFSALAAGIMLAMVNVFMRLFYDISYGLPSSIGEIFLMVAYYLSDILCGILLYTICLFVLAWLDKKVKN